jgi:hypothetical protein
MRPSYSKLLLLTVAVLACSDEPGTTAPPLPPPPPPPPASPLLKDIAIPNLPSPYYHFEYDTTGRVRVASFASGLLTYDVQYVNDRITEMRNVAVISGTRLVYAYDGVGRVSGVRYVDSNGVTFMLVVFSYDGARLTGVERDRLVEGGFIIDKTMTFSYYPDGNLMELTEHRPSIDGQAETTTIDRFEQYDDKINVDGFSLIHDDFFDQLVLLPGVQLQKGNPARQTHTGDGVNFTVDYGYTYDHRNRPLTKSGDLTVLNGSDAGRRFQTLSVFSYY